MKTMQPVNEEIRRQLMTSFKNALKTKKEIRSELIARAKLEKKDDDYKKYKSLIPKLHPVSESSHLMALIIRDFSYKRMLKSYQSPRSLWKQLSELYEMKFEFSHAQSLLRIQNQFSNGVQDIASVKRTKFYDLVKLFNNGEYDPVVAMTLSKQIERAFANCQSEMVSGGYMRDGVDDRGSNYI